MNSGQITQLNLPEKLISFRIGQPSLSILPIELLKEASKNFYKKQNAVKYLQYGNMQGSTQFRNRLSEFLTNEYSSCIHPKELFITAGATSAIDLLCAILTKSGDTVFVEDPTYFIIEKILRNYKLNIVSIPTDKNGICLNILENMIRLHNPKFIYSIPVFQNPSSVTMSEQRRKEFCEICNKHKILIIADEVYHLLNYTKSKIEPLFKYDNNKNVISLGSFSKILAPGLRLGWIHTLNKSIIEKLLNSGIIFSGGGMNAFLSGHILCCIENGNLKKHLEFLKTTFAGRLKILEGNLIKYLNEFIEFTPAEGGFYIWTKLKNNISSTELEKIAKIYDISILPGPLCSINNNFENYMRLSISYLEETEIIEGIKRLQKAIRFLTSSN